MPLLITPLILHADYFDIAMISLRHADIAITPLFHDRFHYLRHFRLIDTPLRHIIDIDISLFHYY
jgi:hypothetical protein